MATKKTLDLTSEQQIAILYVLSVMITMLIILLLLIGVEW